MSTLTDAQLHELARKRVEFGTHILVYFIVIASLWVVWYLTGSHYPWPLWPMMGWGIGVVFHYLFDYRSSCYLSEEEEYKRLK